MNTNQYIYFFKKYDINSNNNKYTVHLITTVSQYQPNIGSCNYLDIAQHQC